MKNVPTLYEWVGGKEVLERLTKVFYAKVLNDDLLKLVFKNIPSDHSRHVAHFIAEVFVGSEFYTIDDKGSHSAVMKAHAGKMLDAAFFGKCRRNRASC